MHFDRIKVHTLASRAQEVSMVIGSTIDFLIENEPHAYVTATTTFLANSLGFDVPLLPPHSLILSLFFCVKA